MRRRARGYSSSVMGSLSTFIQDDAENIMVNEIVSELMFPWERSVCSSPCAVGGERALWAITTPWPMASQNMGREDSTAQGTRETAPVLAESGCWHVENR